MIASFLDSWSLFQHAYASGWLIGVLLSLIGVLVVARDQIFIGAAVSQASLLGIAVGIWLGSLMTVDHQSWWQSDIFHSCMGGLFAILAALMTAHGGRRAGQETHEAMTGWGFLVSISMSILLLSHSPRGLEEINRLLSSTIIGAREQDVWIFAVLTLLTCIALVRFYRPLLLLVLDSEMAQAVGVRTGLLNNLLSIWLGLAVGFSIHVSGVVYTFASLVLPALAAKNLGRTARSLFFIAPCVSFGTGIVSFVLANYYDFPPGQMSAACLSFLLVLAWCIRAVRHHISVACP